MRRRLCQLCVATMLAACTQTRHSDFTPLDDRVLSGVVRSSEGVPIEGAHVAALSAAGLLGEDGYVIDASATDSRGRYELRLPPYVEADRIVATSLGWSERAVNWDAAQPHVDFKMVHGVELEGTVFDAAGNPVAHALVVATGGASTKSDRLGEFKLSGVDPGMTTLTVTHPGYATLREKTVGTRGSIQLVLDDGATLRVNVHSLVPCPLVVAMGHGDVSNDGGVFDIVGLPRNQTVRVDVSCVVERMLFTFHHEVPPPLPPEISIDIPRLQPVRIELVNDLHRPLPFVRFLFAVTRADEREAYPYPLWTDYDGGATVLVAGGRAVMEVITVADEPGGTGQAVARRTWDGERTMRFAWGLSVPPPGELHQQDGSF